MWSEDDENSYLCLFFSLPPSRDEEPEGGGQQAPDSAQGG